MRRGILLWIIVTVGVHVGIQDDSYISKRDREFVGPDKRLELFLKQRMTAPSFVVGDLRALENSLGPKPKPYLPPDDARRQNIHFREYNGEHLKVRILQFQEYLIQLSSGHILEIAPLVEQYQTDERVRIAYSFGKLNQWLNRIRTLYEATIKEGFRKLYTYRPYLRPVIIHYYYYQHMLRAHIDITYTVEFLAYVHTKYIEKMRGLNVSSVFNDPIDKDPAEKYSDVYSKLQGKNVSEEDIKYMLQAAEAGLTFTLPP